MNIITKEQGYFIDWLAAKGYANYNQISSMLNKLNEANLIKNYGNKKLFDIVVRPLYATGMIEAVKKDGSIFYSLVKSEFHMNGKKYLLFDHEYKVDSIYEAEKDSKSKVIELLKKIPAIADITNQWNNKTDSDCKFYERLSDGTLNNEFVYQESLSTGLYGLSSNHWNSSYVLCIKDSTYLKRVPNINESTEGMKIARCRLAQENNETLFGYDKVEKKLYVRRSWDIPVPIMRLLFILDPEKLLKPETYSNNLVETSVFNNIDEEVGNQLQRIFSEACFENPASACIVRTDIERENANKICEKRFGKWGMFNTIGTLPDITFGELIVDYKYSTLQELFDNEFDENDQNKKRFIGEKGENLLTLYPIVGNGKIGIALESELKNPEWP